MFTKECIKQYTLLIPDASNPDSGLSVKGSNNLAILHVDSTLPNPVIYLFIYLLLFFIAATCYSLSSSVFMISSFPCHVSLNYFIGIDTYAFHC